MSHVFISYARSTATEAQAVAAGLRGLGYEVWLDDELPAHRAYADVIEERLREARAVVVIWSDEAVKSQWVRAEADKAREQQKLVQLRVDNSPLPMPFDQIQCADMGGWGGDSDAAGWRKVVASVADLAGGSASPAAHDAGASLPLPNKPSIAVMAFANLSGDPDQGYFADGMVEEIVGALSRYKSIFVIGSGSTFSFKGKAASSQDVGRQLGVRYILEGSVRKAANRVRIAVKLTDASDGAQIWSDRFEDTLEDVFALQDKVALSVAGVIEPTMRQADIRRVSKRPTENMGSYDLYLRAHATAASGRTPDLLAAVELLNKAIDLDPGFGPALATAARLNAILSFSAMAADRAAHRENGLALMRLALQVAGDDPVVIGSVAEAGAVLGRDAVSAASTIDRALALNPGSAALWSMSGRARLAMGEPDLAVQHIETAMRLDPLSSARSEKLADLGCARLLQGRFDEAIVLLQQSIDLRPDFPPCQAWLAAALGHLGRLGEAREALDRFQAFGVGTLEELAERHLRTPASRALFLEGIALARRKNPGARPPG